MRQFRLTAAAIIVASLFAAQAGASNIPANLGMSQKVTGAMLSNLAGFVDGCGGVQVTGHVTVTGVINDGGNGNDNFVVQLYDDGITKGLASFSVPVGATQGFDFQFLFPGPVLTGAPGVGVVVAEVQNGTAITSVDPFFPTVVAGCTIGRSAPVPTISAWGLGTTGALLMLLAGWFGFRRRDA